MSNDPLRSADIEVLFRESTPVSRAKRYPGLHQHSYVLPAGHQQFPGAMVLPCDILVEQDVPVKLRDGVTVRADVYRPVDRTGCPAIMGWSPYGKRGGWLTNDVFGHRTRMDVPVDWEDGLNKFEGPNPAYWVSHGYAVIAPDPRGCFNSEGDIRAWGAPEAQDEYDVIEWVAAQPWSNGKVGLTGNSWLAISQWFVAALKPPHLAAIAPWEGAQDIYRDTLARGGIPDPVFPEGIFASLHGNNQTEDPVAMMRKCPLFNDYWASKTADLSQINVPAYIVASWTNLLHTHGTLAGWRGIRSTQKWLRIHNTHEWTDYYNPDNVEDLRRFFDRFLKGADNGWESTPPVRLTVLDPGNRDTVYRAESDFPLARQNLAPFYLGLNDKAGTLGSSPYQQEASCTYVASGVSGATFRITFDRDVELTGYMKLKLWVQAPDHDDLDIFAFVRKLDRFGLYVEPDVVAERTHVGPNGRLRASLRRKCPTRSTESEPFHPFDELQKLSPDAVVPLEIGFWPYSMRWRAGETLELWIGGTDLLKRPEFPSLPPIPTINRGRHVIHLGGRYDSHLLVPMIPS